MEFVSVLHVLESDMETALWILLWAIGYPIMYGLIFLLFRDETEWDNSARWQAAFWSIFSWLGIVITIFLVILCLVFAGGQWLANKTVTPIFEKYETWVEKAEEWLMKLFKKRTN